MLLSGSLGIVRIADSPTLSMSKSLLIGLDPVALFTFSQWRLSDCKCLLLSGAEVWHHCWRMYNFSIGLGLGWVDVLSQYIYCLVHWPCLCLPSDWKTELSTTRRDVSVLLTPPCWPQPFSFSDRLNCRLLFERIMLFTSRSTRSIMIIFTTCRLINMGSTYMKLSVSWTSVENVLPCAVPKVKQQHLRETCKLFCGWICKSFCYNISQMSRAKGDIVKRLLCHYNHVLFPIAVKLSDIQS